MLHLVTAADGALEHYTDKEYTPEQAKALDRRMNESWNGHSKYVIVKNVKDQDFRSKVSFCLTSVLSLMGIPTSNKYYQKYLIDPSAEIEFPKDIKVERHILSECFLFNENPEVQIRLSKKVS